MKRHANDPLALIGIDTDKDKAVYTRLASEIGITWRNSWQGGQTGALPIQYGVTGYPTMFVLDGAGKIRYVNARGERLDQAVDALLTETRGR